MALRLQTNSRNLRQCLTKIGSYCRETITQLIQVKH